MFDLSIPKEVLDELGKHSEEIKKKALQIIKEEANNLLAQFSSISPYQSGKLRSKWIVKESKYGNGYVITNTRQTDDKKGNLAFILNNQENNKHYQFFERYWNSVRESVNNKIVERINQII